MKLSPAQAKVVRRMREGWALYRNAPYCQRDAYFLLKGGLGRADAAETPSRRTIKSLERKGYIYVEYRLTPAGWEVELPK